ncbi:MAG: hypothetical protein PHC56_06650 [Herbinix sp.]|nr:hypothetical protein [Herbinix sp.]
MNRKNLESLRVYEELLSNYYESIKKKEVVKKNNYGNISYEVYVDMRKEERFDYLSKMRNRIKYGCLSCGKCNLCSMWIKNRWEREYLELREYLVVKKNKLERGI